LGMFPNPRSKKRAKTTNKKPNKAKIAETQERARSSRESILAREAYNLIYKIKFTFV